MTVYRRASSGRWWSAGQVVSLLIACSLVSGGGSHGALAQSLPALGWPDLRPELHAYVCQVAHGGGPVATTEAERLRFEMRARYREFMPAFMARVGDTPPEQLVMPVDGVRVAQVANTFGAARSGGRGHDGQDIFAPRGTPVRAAAPGFVYRIDDLSLGGLSVTVVGDGGWRHYYTHFDAVPEELVEGQRVEVGTLIGFVGNSGNAAGTPTHLHYGVYRGTEDDVCAWEAFDPMPMLVDRP